MTAYETISVSSKQYEDYDDSLTAAAQEYASEHGLELWQVTAEWEGGEEGQRDAILLTVPERRVGIHTKVLYAYVREVKSSGWVSYRWLAVSTIPVSELELDVALSMD